MIDENKEYEDKRLDNLSSECKGDGCKCCLACFDSKLPQDTATDTATAPPLSGKVSLGKIEIKPNKIKFNFTLAFNIVLSIVVVVSLVLTIKIRQQVQVNITLQEVIIDEVTGAEVVNSTKTTATIGEALNVIAGKVNQLDAKVSQIGAGLLNAGQLKFSDDQGVIDNQSIPVWFSKLQSPSGVSAELR